MTCRSRGSAPVPSSGNRSATCVHRTSGRPRWSSAVTHRSTSAPWSRASRRISSAETACMARVASAGPWRRLRAMTPPGLSRLTSFRKARPRSDGAMCIQTALSRITSNAKPVLRVRRRAGNESASHRIAGSVWRSRAIVRMRGEGSTATTSYPRDESHAASRPLPAPTSRAAAGAAGSRSASHPCSRSGGTPSYRAEAASALASYQAIGSVIRQCGGACFAEVEHGFRRSGSARGSVGEVARSDSSHGSQRLPEILPVTFCDVVSKSANESACASGEGVGPGFVSSTD